MNLYLLIYMLVITLSFVYGNSIEEECKIVNNFNGITVSDDCCSNYSITCDSDGHITKM